jgi:hypothetical protein
MNVARTHAAPRQGESAAAPEGGGMRAGLKDMVAGVVLMDAVLLRRGYHAGRWLVREGRDNCGCRAGFLDRKPLDISL